MELGGLRGGFKEGRGLAKVKADLFLKNVEVFLHWAVLFGFDLHTTTLKRRIYCDFAYLLNFYINFIVIL